MTTTEYPYTAWTLMPSFKPVEVVFVKRFASWGAADYGDVTEKGKRVDRSRIFPDKASAIAAGWAMLKQQEADESKRRAARDKREAALRKACA